jgi:hypothetical protein
MTQMLVWIFQTIVQLAPPIKIVGYVCVCVGAFALAITAMTFTLSGATKLLHPCTGNTVTLDRVSVSVATAQALIL